MLTGKQNDKKAIEYVESHLRIFSKAGVFAHLDPTTKISDILDMPLSSGKKEDGQTLRWFIENAVKSSIPMKLEDTDEDLDFFEMLEVRDAMVFDVSGVMEYFTKKDISEYLSS
jgi:hypothetical protein